MKTTLKVNKDITFDVPQNWSVIDSKDYEKYSIQSNKEAPLLCIFLKDSTFISLIDFSRADNSFFKEIELDFKSVNKEINKSISAGKNWQDVSEYCPITAEQYKKNKTEVYIVSFKTQAQDNLVALQVYFKINKSNYFFNTVVSDVSSMEEIEDLEMFKEIISAIQSMGIKND